MSSIFISYRRVGALVHARALFERLRHEFGANEVFIDLEGVDFGLDFVDILNEQLNGCQVMLAVIDPQWATAVDRQGQRRIDREFDYVRTEIVTALRRGIRTVPVLIDGAEMPDGGDLPEPLRALTRRNALILDFNRFDAEISRLIGVIRKILAAASAEVRVPMEANRAHHQEAMRSRQGVNGRGREFPEVSERRVADKGVPGVKVAEDLGIQQDAERHAKCRVDALRLRQDEEHKPKGAEEKALPPPESSLPREGNFPRMVEEAVAEGVRISRLPLPNVQNRGARRLRIKITDSVGPSQEVELGEGETVTLGRGTGNVVALMDPHVSARHAELFVRGGRIWVRDLRSSNGVYVDGRRIAQVEAIDHRSVVHLSHDGPSISVLVDGVTKTVPDETAAGPA